MANELHKGRSVRMPVGLIALAAAGAIGTWASAGAVGSGAKSPGHSSAAPASAQQAALSLIGQLGGITQGVDLVGSTAYAGIGQRLVVLDVSDPASPTVLGQTEPLGARAYHVAAWDGHAYVALGETGMRIVDVSDPSAPRVVGELAGTVWGVDRVDDEHACTAGAHLGIVDVALPSAPREVSSAPVFGLDVAVDGATAYVAGSAFATVDITDPLSPTPLAATSDLEWVSAFAVDVVGTRAYVVDYLLGMRIYDVGDPTRIEVLGELTSDFFMATAGVAVEGSVAVVASGLGVYVVDVADPAAPFAVAAVSIEGTAWDAAVANGLACIAAGEGGVRLLDVSDAPRAAETGAYAVLADVQGMALGSGFAYVAGGDRLTAVAIADAANPAVGSYVRIEPALGVAVSGALAAVNAGWAERDIQVVDLSNPEAPTLAGAVEVDASPAGLFLSGRHAYVASEFTSDFAGPHELSVIDLADAASPAIVGSCDLANDAVDVFVGDGYAYVATYGGLSVVDVRDPSAPEEVAALDLGAEALAVAGAPGLAYVGTTDAGLHVVDVSDPAAPRRLAVYRASESVFDVALSDTTAFLGLSTGLCALDVTDGAAAREVAFLPLPSTVSALAAEGQTVFAATYSDGLEVVRFDLGGMTPTATAAAPATPTGQPTPAIAEGLYLPWAECRRD